MWTNRHAALTEKGQPQGDSPLEEGKLASADETAKKILHAIKKRKRTLVMTFTGKQTVFINKFFPGLADKLVRNFFYKEGKLMK